MLIALHHLLRQNRNVRKQHRRRASSGEADRFQPGGGVYDASELARGRCGAGEGSIFEVVRLWGLVWFGVVRNSLTKEHVCVSITKRNTQ